MILLEHRSIQLIQKKFPLYEYPTDAPKIPSDMSAYALRQPFLK